MGFTMKLSIFYHHLQAWAKQKDLSIDEVLEAARALGITHVEVDRDDVGDPKAFYTRLRNHDLQTSSIYGFYDWVQRPDDFCDDLQIKQGFYLQCDKLMVIPGFYTSKNLAVRNDQKQQMLQSMHNFMERAGAARMTVTIEDFDLDTSPICNCQGMQDFEEQLSGLRTTFDTGNFYYSGEDALSVFPRLANSIVHVHLKDRLILPVGRNASALPAAPEKLYGTPKETTEGVPMYPCSVGAGCIPIRQILKQLHLRGYDDCCAMEFFDAADYEQTARDSVDFLMDTGYFG